MTKTYCYLLRRHTVPALLYAAGMLASNISTSAASLPPATKNAATGMLINNTTLFAAPLPRTTKNAANSAAAPCNPGPNTTRFTLIAASLPDAPLEIGASLPKPDMPLYDVSGREITLSGARGAKGLLVMFTGNSCPYVLRNQQRIKDVCRYALRNGIGVVLVNSNTALSGGSESPEAMKAYAAAQQYAWYYVTDKKAEIADAFGADHTPECYLFDANAKLVYKGGIDDSPGNAATVKTKHLHNALADLLAGKPVQVNNTSALGCSIKRF